MMLTELRLHIDSYIELRHSLGFKIRYEEPVLRAFAKELEEQGHRGPIRAHTVVNWAINFCPRKAGPAGQRLRLVHLRCFLRYLKASFPETEIPASHLLTPVARPKPHIYSQDEVAQLQQATRSVWRPGSMRQQALCTFIGLLSCTGLRAAEGLGLMLNDLRLDADPPTILIRNTKFQKSRLIPIHPTTAEKLRRYLRRRKRLWSATTSNAVFLNDSGKSLRYPAARRDFVAITNSIGIQKNPGRRRVGLHCLRHTFAVERLVSWYRAGFDVRSMLPHLSVYLGHVRPEDTYWYMTATPELLATASVKFQRYVNVGGPDA
jgi:integrase/recombinase XerD